MGADDESPQWVLALGRGGPPSWRAGTCAVTVPGRTWHVTIIQHKHLTWGLCRHCDVPKEGRKACVWLWPACGAFPSCGPSSQAAVSSESCSFFFQLDLM